MASKISVFDDYDALFSSQPEERMKLVKAKFDARALAEAAEQQFLAKRGFYLVKQQDPTVNEEFMAARNVMLQAQREKNEAEVALDAYDLLSLQQSSS